MEKNMDISNKTSRIVARALAASIAFTGFLQAQACNKSEVIRFSMISTEAIYDAVFTLDTPDTEQLFGLISSYRQQPLTNVS